MKKRKEMVYEEAKKRILAIGLRPTQYEAVLKVFVDLLHL